LPRDVMPMTAPEGSVADPVFVLCNGRSGSTLLRFLLDAHPDLACPPETNLPVLCVQLATVWSLIEGAPLSAKRGDEPPEIPAAAIAGVRDTMDRMVGSYLARRGKKRYCDKSLGTARYAQLLQRVYPKARFICIYRHPMDVIASGLEACPWGLNGYGFDPYIAATPGNAVMGLANFWVDHVQAMLTVEERFTGKCFRLRYEDLVADPEAAAGELFEFLGVAPAPGISRRCFAAERERFGPGDHKIWYTSEISSDSVGRGWSVPAAMIAPHLLGVINELTSKLGYLTVDGDWGTTAPPASLLVPVSAPPADADTHADAIHKAVGPEPEEGISKAAGLIPAAHAADTFRKNSPSAAAGCELVRSRWLGEALQAGLAACHGRHATEWGPHACERFVVVAVAQDRGDPAEYWLVDLANATVNSVGKEAQEDSDWDVVGTLEAWEKVIGRRVNFSVALRSCQLRYCDNGDTAPLAADTRIGIIGQILGLAGWQ
jgi:hypothetical protein